MQTHRIRLRGPWQIEWDPLPADASTEGDRSYECDPGRTGKPVSTLRTIRLPEDSSALFGQRRGRVRLTRRFHRPTNLGPGDEVALVFGRLGGHASLTLNGRAMATLADREAPEQIVITSLLQDVNLFTVEMEIEPGTADDQQSGLWGNFALEIREGGRKA